MTIMPGAREDVLNIIRAEMDTTERNAGDYPVFKVDYMADIVRKLNNELPYDARFFKGADHPADEIEL